MKKLTAGVLFAGIGAACLGLERAGFEIIWQCEVDPFCRSVLDVRFPKTKKYEDIKNVENPAATNLIFGSPPCQPYSDAGSKAGNSDDRALWPEMRRIIEETRPAWVVLENVAGIVGMVEPCQIPGVETERNHPLAKNNEKIDIESGILHGILEDFETIGYDVIPYIIPACAVDAPHRRDRLWIVAHSRGDMLQEERPFFGVDQKKNGKQYIRDQSVRLGESEWPHDWQRITERDDDGPADRVDRSKRLHAIGNSVVPQIVEIIGKMIIEADSQSVS